MVKQKSKKTKWVKNPLERKTKPPSVYHPRKLETLALNRGIIKHNTIKDIEITPLLKKEKDVIKIPANLKMKELLESFRAYTPGGFIYKHGTRRQTVQYIKENIKP